MGPSQVPVLEWIGVHLGSAASRISPPPWALRVGPRGLVFGRDAWEYLAEPKAFDIGWDAPNDALWLVPSSTGLAVRPIARGGGSATQLRYAVRFSLGSPAIVAEVRRLGFVTQSYLMWPQFCEPEKGWAFYVPVQAVYNEEFGVTSSDVFRKA